ncbi:phage tail tip lysozyme [Coprococcus comes]|uniref:Phage tail lysozyme domain-containing protein n=1 Tax=Coprococcus comes TaxID=410072 RepID=A0A3R6IKT8_9FIRM|nr:phage tail tip lysozyme [Coprococcus comes]RHG58953.1 hypothetical protein DW252_12680 [Coprococcus comes]
MRADDFVTGDSARGAGQSSLVGTESTNAVNTGLVGSAAAIAKNMVIGGTELGDVDKMYQAGKSAVKGSVNAARAGSDLAKDTVDTAKTTAKAFKAGLNGENIDLSGTKSRSGKNLAKGAKKAAKDGFRAAKRAAIKDSELEDVDNLYQEAKGLSKATVSSAKGAVSNTRKSWKMLKRSTARIKALSRKRFTAGAGNKFNQQMYKYMRSAAYRSVSTSSGIVSTVKNAMSVIYWDIRLALSSISSAIGLFLGFLGILPLLLVVFVPIFFLIFGTISGTKATTVGSLTGDEATIAQYLIDKGVDRTHIAAIMGNMFQESGCRPTAINPSSGAYGICQWLGGRKTGLENLAKQKGKDMSDLSVQLDWFWDEFAESCSGWNKAKYKVFCAQSDLKQCVYLFRSQFERCGESEAADANRLAQAQRIYDALGTSNGTNGIDGNGQDLKKATRRQKDVVNAANTTTSPGQGWCAAWVTNVFQNAGIGYFGGNACDMCRAYCTSTNVRDLKVGMIIADVSHPGTGDAGRLYGHVGIYIGDNKVISNEGPITIKSLQEFVGFYGKGTGCKWGWLGGVDLSK